MTLFTDEWPYTDWGEGGSSPRTRGGREEGAWEMITCCGSAPLGSPADQFTEDSCCSNFTPKKYET